MSAGGHAIRFGGPSRAAKLAWTIAAVSLGLCAAALIADLTDLAAGPDVEGRDWLLAALCAPLGARLAAHSARNAIGWLFLAVGWLASGTVAMSIIDSPVAVWFRDWLWWPSYGLLILIALLFPDGRPVGRGWRFAVAGTAAMTVAGTIGLAHLSARLPGDLLGEGDTSRVSAGWDTTVILAAYAALFGFALSAVVAMVIRVRRTPRADRGLLVLAGCNAVLLVVAFILDSVGGMPLVWLGAALAIPAATVIGVVRYGLYDIDLLVHRSLLYGLFVCVLIAGYTATVAFTVRFVSAAPAPLAAAVVLMALLPLRRRLDVGLQRALYGISADPYRLATSLSRRIGMAGTPDQVLAVAVRVIGEGIKAPYVAVDLGRWSTVLPAYGRRRDWPMTTLPLRYRGTVIGALLVQRRSADEGWSRREQALLRHLAEQLAPSAASVSLTHELQAARESLVHAREEELRRLQRELHDGVGPLLAGARMLARGVREGEDVAVIRARIAELQESLAEAATEVRRIVTGLRPPALDRGLETALTRLLHRHRSSGLPIELVCAGEVTDLSAAVEVAIYRVADEALTNVVKHANAAKARVEIHRDGDALRIVVEDDGVGGATARRDGVGLSSMRRRCAELGGTFEVGDLRPGTRLVGVIPLGTARDEPQLWEERW